MVMRKTTAGTIKIKRRAWMTAVSRPYVRIDAHLDKLFGASLRRDRLYDFQCYHWGESQRKTNKNAKS